jgi:hypothetical protein
MSEFTWSIYDTITAPTTQSSTPVSTWQHLNTTTLDVFPPQAGSSQYTILPPIPYPEFDAVGSGSSTPAWPSPNPAAITQEYFSRQIPSHPSSPIHQQTQAPHVFPQALAEAYWGDFVSTVPNVRSPMLVRLCLALYEFARNTSTSRVPKQPLTAAKPFLLPEMVIAIFDLSLDTDLLPFSQSEIRLFTQQKIDVGM